MSIKWSHCKIKLFVVIFYCFLSAHFQFRRQCPRLQDDGQPCDYRAPSARAFKRHLLTWHSLKQITRWRDDEAVEEFVQIPEQEVRYQRARLSCRQGGRSAQRRELGRSAAMRRQLRPAAERRRIGQAVSTPPSPSAKPSTLSPQPEVNDEPPKTFTVTSESLVSNSPATTSHHVTKVILSSDSAFTV